MMTRPDRSDALMDEARFINATGPSYSSPWLAPVSSAVGPLPFFATVIGIITAPHAESSRLYGSRRNPCCTPSRSKSTVAEMGLARFSMINTPMPDLSLAVRIALHALDAHGDVAAPDVPDCLQVT